ncbi:hypothetical protein MBLNU459_g6087t1 [Dothideomycetes sp. NU459]
MRFSTIFTSALVGLSAHALSIPSISNGIEKRQTDSAYEIVSSLYTSVQQYTAVINSTAASLSSSSTAADNATAAIAYQEAVGNITALVQAATTQVDALDSTSLKRSSASELASRQVTADALATLVENLLLDISGALNNIIATLGLTSLLSGLTPLVSSLSGLLLSLETVVNNLLALVQALLDGLLTGLSVGLAGITL